MPTVRGIAAAVLCALFPAVAQAQFVGVSAFAALSPDYPCDALLAATDFSARPAIAVLDGTFGDDWTCVARFVQRNAWRPHLVQVHLSNETCRRNGNCAEGELYAQFNVREWSKLLEQRNPHAFQAIADRLINLQTVLASFTTPNTSIILSTGLEDNFTDGAFAVLYPFVVSHWPYQVVRSGKKTSGVLRESHGSNARCSGNTVVANEDGQVHSIAASDRWLAKQDRCYATFIWRADHQGRGVRNGRVTASRTPPRKRKFKFSATDVRQLGGLLFKYTH